jgi:hypothetical protein
MNNTPLLRIGLTEYVPVTIVEQHDDDTTTIICPHCIDGIMEYEDDNERNHIVRSRGKCCHCNGNEEITINTEEIC